VGRDLIFTIHLMNPEAASAASLARRPLGLLDHHQDPLAMRVSLDRAVDNALHPELALGEGYDLAVLLDPDQRVQFFLEQVAAGLVLFSPAAGIAGLALPPPTILGWLAGADLAGVVVRGIGHRWSPKVRLISSKLRPVAA
jgi:hypothetical protein